MTTQWRSLLVGSVLALVLLTGLGCTPAETSLPLSSTETADSLGGGAEALPAPTAESSAFGPDATDGLGAFPTFMPSVAQGTVTQECQLGTDSYSTCI